MRTETEVRDVLNRTSFAWGQPNRDASDDWIIGVTEALEWVTGEVEELDLTNGKAIPAREVP